MKKKQLVSLVLALFLVLTAAGTLPAHATSSEPKLGVTMNINRVRLGVGYSADDAKITFALVNENSEDVPIGSMTLRCLDNYGMDIPIVLTTENGLDNMVVPAGGELAFTLSLPAGLPVSKPSYPVRIVFKNGNNETIVVAAFYVDLVAPPRAANRADAGEIIVPNAIVGRFPVAAFVREEPFQGSAIVVKIPFGTEVSEDGETYHDAENDIDYTQILFDLDGVTYGGYIAEVYVYPLGTPYEAMKPIPPKQSGSGSDTGSEAIPDPDPVPECTCSYDCHHGQGCDSGCGC